MSQAPETDSRGRADDVRGGTPLPVGTLLGDFEIKGVVGEGGFGIVYEALDRALQRRIAIKEYMPGALADRKSDRSVVVRSKHHEQTFRAGMRSFINEARMLAAFDHPALVKVFSFWEQHGTAYMAMPLYEGRTLKSVLRDAPKPGEAWLKALFAPLLDALASLHRSECYHRDVAPDNIMILPSGAPVLLDFGAARRIIGNMTQDVTVILKPGYAPIEQYADDPSMQQGPWTDVYAVAAVMYLAITGKPPPTPVTRIVSDTMKPLRGSTDEYSDEFLAGIDRGLAVRPENRPQTIAEFRDALGIPAGGPGVFPARWTTPPNSAPKSADPISSVPDALRPSSPAQASGAAGSVGSSARQDSGAASRGEAVADAEATRAGPRIPVSRADVETKSGSALSRAASASAVTAQRRHDDKPLPAGRRIPWKPVLSLIALVGLLLVGATIWMRGKSEPGVPPTVSDIAAAKPTPAPALAPPPPAAPQALPEDRSRQPEPPPRVGSSRPAETGIPAPIPRSPTAVPPADSRPPVVATPGEPPPPVLKTGKLQFSVRPWGEIVIDGKSRGISPPLKELSIPEGSHRIEIRNASFPGYSGNIVVKAGSNVSITHSFK